MEVAVKITRGGRLVIPAGVRKALDIQEGSNWILQTKGPEIRLVPVREAIKQLQRTAARWLKNTPSLADELIAERRQEALKENS